MRGMLLIIVILAIPNLASAVVYLDGNELYDLLSHERNIHNEKADSKDFVRGSIGSGYVTGVIDATANCVPEAVNKRQLLDIAFRYLEAHPEQRHLPAPGLVMRAVTEKFPCPKSPPSVR